MKSQEVRLREIELQLQHQGINASNVSNAVNTHRYHIKQLANQTKSLSCNACSLSCKGSVEGVGPSNSPILIAGESPGPDDLDWGIPFIGLTGTFLTLVLNSLGVYRGNIFITNSTRCNHEDPNGVLYTPDEAQIKACHRYLLNDIMVVKPKVIIALGNCAMRSITSNFNLKISRERGTIKDLVIANHKTKFMATWHPSYVVRQVGQDFDVAKMQFYKDMKSAITLAKQLDPTYPFAKLPII